MSYCVIHSVPNETDDGWDTGDSVSGVYGPFTKEQALDFIGRKDADATWGSFSYWELQEGYR